MPSLYWAAAAKERKMMSAHEYLCHTGTCLDWAGSWLESARFYPFNDVDDEHAKRLAIKAREMADRLEELRVRNAA